MTLSKPTQPNPTHLNPKSLLFMEKKNTIQATTSSPHLLISSSPHLLISSSSHLLHLLISSSPHVRTKRPQSPQAPQATLFHELTYSVTQSCKAIKRSKEKRKKKSKSKSQRGTERQTKQGKGKGKGKGKSKGKCRCKTPCTGWLRCICSALHMHLHCRRVPSCHITSCHESCHVMSNLIWYDLILDFFSVALCLCLACVVKVK